MADSDIFIRGIYKHLQQPVNGGRRVWSCRGFHDNGDGM